MVNFLQKKDVGSIRRKRLTPSAAHGSEHALFLTSPQFLLAVAVVGTLRDNNPPGFSATPEQSVKDIRFGGVDGHCIQLPSLYLPVMWCNNQAVFHGKRFFPRPAQRTS